MGKRICLNMLIVLMISFFSSITMADRQEQMVDVGLDYGENLQYSTDIESEHGFLFGTDSNGVFESLIDLRNYDALTFYKAGYYIGDTLVTNNTAYYASGNVKGAYTLRIGQSESELEQIYDVFLTYKAQNKDVFLVYDGQWYMSIGQYLSESEAESDKSNIAGIYGDIDIAVEKLSQYQMTVYGDSMPLLSYNTSLNDFIFKTDFFSWKDHTYRNSIMFKRLEGTDYAVINHVTLSEYLYGVVPKEMSSTWPIEALKAQAVAARNYTVMNLGEHAENGFDVCTTTDCQSYGGFDAEGTLSNKAVDDTKGEILLYNDELVTCFYHANSGGHTEDVSNVWSGSLPYLKGISDPYSLGQPNAIWTLTLTADEIEKKLADAGYDIGDYKGVEINERSDNGHVIEITFKGSEGKAVLLKESMRAVFGYTTVKSMQFSLEEEADDTLALRGDEGTVTSLRSSLYTISASGIQSMTDNIYALSNDGIVSLENSTGSMATNSRELTLYGKGYGHGLGMSQWGAYTMAEENFDYVSILLFYYSGTTLSQM